jgi:hypothetical protein
MSSTTREVFVLADFKDHKRGDVFTVAYETDRQRLEVNEMIHRGFLTLEVRAAREHQEQEQRRSARKQRAQEKG